MIRQQIGRLWAEVKTMPRRWLVPFLLNLPTVKGSSQGSSGKRSPADRAEIDVFTANGFTTVAEISTLIGFTDTQYDILWSELAIESRGGPPLAATAPEARFAAVWNHLPLEDELIARLMMTFFTDEHRLPGAPGEMVDIS